MPFEFSHGFSLFFSSVLARVLPHLPAFFNSCSFVPFLIALRVSPGLFTPLVTFFLILFVFFSLCNSHFILSGSHTISLLSFFFNSCSSFPFCVASSLLLPFVFTYLIFFIIILLIKVFISTFATHFHIHILLNIPIFLFLINFTFCSFSFLYLVRTFVSTRFSPGLTSFHPTPLHTRVFLF